MVDVAALYTLSTEEAVKASAKDWKTPADWPICFDSGLGIWNIRTGVPVRVSRGISLRPYWTPGKGGFLTDSEIRQQLPAVVASRVLELLSLVQPPRHKVNKQEKS